MVAAICTIAVLLLRHKQFAARLSVPFLALSLWVIMNGISTLYAVSGKFALWAFVVLLASFCFWPLPEARMTSWDVDLPRCWRVLRPLQVW
ncbi:Uncharacterised protein [Flavonifractor plautii]|uniref:Uncharacterized protein n=1 Tax=Flavonifractor plautii TaxID=292800 RepID=A0A6N3GZ72_FLAPL